MTIRVFGHISGKYCWILLKFGSIERAEKSPSSTVVFAYSARHQGSPQTSSPGIVTDCQIWPLLGLPGSSTIKIPWANWTPCLGANLSIWLLTVLTTLPQRAGPLDELSILLNYCLCIGCKIYGSIGNWCHWAQFRGQNSEVTIEAVLRLPWPRGH